ncbi:DUF2125 domain-containing protein [Pseudoroseicyclus sp. H15]
MTRSILAPATALASILALPAFADVTAEDVWLNMTRSVTALGIEVSATPQRDGDVLSVGQVTYSYAFPEDAGQLEITSAGPELTEEGDGTVTVTYPESFAMILDGVATMADPYSEGDNTLSLHAALDVTLKQSALASGTPDEVTYATTGSGLSLVLTEFSAEEDGYPTMPGDVMPTFEMYLDYDELVGTSTISSTGGAVDVTSDTTMTGLVQDMSFGVPGEVSIHSVGTVEEAGAQVTMALPGGAPDLMNLSDALRRGLSIEVTSRATGTQSQTITTEEYSGSEVSQSQNVGQQTSTLTFDSAGLVADVEAEDVSFSMSAPELGFPVDVSFAGGTLGLTIPVNASEEPQLARYAFRVEELNGSEDLWAMIDPAGSLPHEPISFGMGATAELTVKQDLLDFNGLMEDSESGELPVDVNSVAFDNLDVQALGAQLTGSGSFLVDLSQMIAGFGEPSLEGSADFNLTGLNAALNTLSSSGMIPAEAIMGVRMSVGMFAEAAGEDALTSHIEVKPDGTILANGQQIR